MTSKDTLTGSQTTGKKVMVTGIAGFIGFHLAERLMSKGHSIIGIDNINDYYDIELKLDRLRELGFTNRQIDHIRTAPSTARAFKLTAPDRPGLVFYKTDLSEKEKMEKIFGSEKPELVMNLAAQAGVRYSLKNPHTYIKSNIVGFLNILENCRHHRVRHLVYASSSSVYGSNEKMPFSVHHNVDHPVSLYAATKKSSELMAHTYSHLFKLPTTGLRFFTVYGPWGRPDMAAFTFTKKIIEGAPIEVYNYGNMKRDFTYIDDIVEGICRVIEKIPGGNREWDGQAPDPATSRAPYRVFNIGNHRPMNLEVFIHLIEQSLGKKARMEMLPLQKGDIVETYADTADLHDWVGFKPSTPLEEGIPRFIEWYTKYYGIKQ